MSDLNKVILHADVYAVCLNHALSTEKEEVMGLLLGKIDEENQISYIKACKILARSDKRPDRVEISPEQLTDATTYAEMLSENLREPIRVIGWYHSHPHITVWPSHVDLKTQSMYQTMEKYFVGFIFSVFSSDPDEQTIHLTCFQTLVDGARYNRIEIPFQIVGKELSLPCLKSAITLPEILNQEEVNSFENVNPNDILSKMHNDALRTIAFVGVTSKISGPLVATLEEVIKAKQEIIEILKQRIKNKIRE